MQRWLRILRWRWSAAYRSAVRQLTGAGVQAIRTVPRGDDYRIRQERGQVRMALRIHP